jgi:hypothetical protein
MDSRMNILIGQDQVQEVQVALGTLLVMGKHGEQVASTIRTKIEHRGILFNPIS